jgi:hypothetical protein
MTQEDWDTCSNAAQEIFNFGQKAAGELRFCSLGLALYDRYLLIILTL